MIHDLSPGRFNNRYLPNRKIGENDFILHYNENSLLWKYNGDEYALPRKRDFPEMSDNTKTTFLFTLDDVPYFLIGSDLKEDPPGLEYKDIGFFRTVGQQDWAWISLVGYHLMNWYRQNKYCGKCGSRMQHKTDERALECTDCNVIAYPRISPAIMAAVVCNDKILLARNSGSKSGWYSLLAGYVDVGESLEEALNREVKEEVGLDVTNIRYSASQPWPLSGSVIMAFIAEADDKQPISIDGKEIADAAWFTRGNLPKHSTKLSIAGEMIDRFEKGKI